MRITRHINQIWNRGRYGDENWYTYLFFAVLRLVLVFIPQIGYVHPDEFFQTVEVMTGDHFRLEHVRTWEFNNTMPMRSVTMPFFLLRVPWSFLEFVAMYMKYYFNMELLNAYTYLVFPRLIYCLLSFVNDWSMFRICRVYSLRFEIRLLAMGSSWIMLVFGTRTFSNTLEMALCSLLLCLVAEAMIRTNTIVYKKEILDEKYEKASSISERVKLWKLKNSLPAHNFSYMIIVSTICVAGVFNRPTFLLFGAPMVFYYMLRGMGTRTVTFKDFNMRMFFFIMSSIPALIFFIFCDSLYYKHLTTGELMMLEIGIQNFVFTPWNFVKYNLDSSKTAEHGLHPRYIHLLVNFPLLFNILGIIAMISFARLMIRFFRAEYQGLPRAQSIVGLMSGAIFVPLFFLSLINHQEARFLLPVLFPILLLHAPKLITGFCSGYPFKEEHPFLRSLYNNILCTKASAKHLLKIWYICNLAMTVFYGFVHQAGVFPLAQHFEQVTKLKNPSTQMHLINSHIYSMPLHFVNLPSSHVLHFNPLTGQKYGKQKDFYLYEYGGMELPQLLQKTRLIISNAEFKFNQKKQNYRVFLAIPTSLSDDLSYILEKSNNSYINIELQHIFYPHLSTEAFPKLHGRHPCDIHPPHLDQDDLKGTCSLELPPTVSYSYIIRQFSSFVHQFGLALYEVQLKRKIQQLDIHLQNYPSKS